MGADGFALRRVTGTAAGAAAERLLEVYAHAFAGPPWHEAPAGVAEHRPVLEERLARPDIEVVLAEEGDQLIGAAYGWPAPDRLPDSDLYRRITAAVGEDVVRSRLTGGVFELVELMVHPAHQRRGLGRQLLEEVCAGRRAWLLTDRGGPGAALYDRTGWTVAGEVPGAGVTLLLYVRAGGGSR